LKSSQVLIDTVNDAQRCALYLDCNGAYLAVDGRPKNAGAALPWRVAKISSQVVASASACCLKYACGRVSLLYDDHAVVVAPCV
jgi:hypothetical protein